MSDPIFGRTDAVWLNEPRRWTAQGDRLEVVTDEATDFWRETHYGFTRDTGHFLGVPTREAFTAEVRVQGDFQALYDQAGLMVRVDAHHWAKAGIEVSDGRAMLASVLTNGQSDWATAPYAHDAGDFWMRATVANGVLRLQVSAEASSGRSCGWRHLPRQAPIWWGRWPAHPSGPGCGSHSRRFV